MQLSDLTRLSEAMLHIGYSQDEIGGKTTSPVERIESKRVASGSVVDASDENPALQGYLSVLFLLINSVCGQLPSGLLSTTVL